MISEFNRSIYRQSKNSPSVLIFVTKKYDALEFHDDKNKNQSIDIQSKTDLLILFLFELLWNSDNFILFQKEYIFIIVGEAICSRLEVFLKLKSVTNRFCGKIGRESNKYNIKFPSYFATCRDDFFFDFFNKNRICGFFKSENEDIL